MVKLPDEYVAATNRPAEQIFNYSKNNGLDPVFLRDERSQKPIGWVIPSILSTKECTELVEKAEDFGIDPCNKGFIRSAKRTTNYVDKELSSRLLSRLDGFNKMVIDDKLGPVYSIHQNWRIVRYDSGDQFPAHMDQMDSFQIKNADDGKKDLVASSHTLLINLSKDGIQGGATRFYPKKDMGNRYGYAVDVILPRGWALVFRQRGTLHAGQPVLGVNEQKYVAQAGVMRLIPQGTFVQPSIFKHGPGLQEAAAQGMSEASRDFFDDSNRKSLLPAHLA